MNRFGRRSLILTTSAFATLSAPAIHAQSRGALRVGLGPQQPTQADTRRVWEPLYRLVAERLGLSLTLNVANDWAGISVALQNEQIDIAQMGPWGYILAHVNGGSRIVNTMLVNGIPTYKAIIVGRPGLSIALFQPLRRRRLRSRRTDGDDQRSGRSGHWLGYASQYDDPQWDDQRDIQSDYLGIRTAPQ